MSLVTVNNLYENGVCDEFTIYTGTTYNGDPYIIPVSAQSIGSHSLPHTFDVGGYEGPLYIFLVHCDFYVTPPPSETPKRQGGFQVKLINIDCENCPPFSPVATPSPTSTPTATPTTDCNFTVNFVEYSPSPSPTPTPSPSPSPSVTASPTPTPTDEVACQCFEINSNRQGYFSYSYVDCNGVIVNATSDTPPMEEITFYVCAQSIISVAEKVTYSVYGTCTDGVCDNTPAPSPTPSSSPAPSPSPSPSPTPSPSPSPTEGPCVCIEFSHNSSGTRYYGYDDCSGVPQTGTTYTQETFSVCGSGQNITVSDPKLSYSIGSDCVGGICPPPNPTPTPTPSPTTEVSALTCNFVFVPNNVDTTNQGLDYFQGGETAILTPFSNLLGTLAVYQGVGGSVYGVCSQTTPLWFDFGQSGGGGAVTDPSGVERPPSGGSCTQNRNCTYEQETTEISAILLCNTTSEPNNANCDEGNDGVLENRVFVLYNTTWFTTNASGKNVVKSTFSLTDNEIINGGDSSYTIHPDSIWTGGPSVFRNSSDGTYMISDNSTEGTEKLLFQKNGNFGTTNKCGGGPGGFN